MRPSGAYRAFCGNWNRKTAKTRLEHFPAKWMPVRVEKMRQKREHRIAKAQAGFWGKSDARTKTAVTALLQSKMVCGI
jgi:hypothetical protein